MRRLAWIDRKVGEQFEDIQLKMLEAAARLRIGDAVAADFVAVGVERKATHMLIHNVIFHTE